MTVFTAFARLRSWKLWAVFLPGSFLTNNHGHANCGGAVVDSERESRFYADGGSAQRIRPSTAAQMLSTLGSI